jgi:glycosyltransferase involved in cell wall biosynthesis
MRLLIVHHESEYFAGAERMLGYFLDGLLESNCQVAVAAVRDSKMAALIPEDLRCCWLPQNARFSLANLLRQGRALRDWHRAEPFDLIHGWAARDWELTALAGKWTRRPTVGTLHDHPQARFISKSRQRLMRWSAGLGLREIACVSEAVRKACLECGYPPSKLVTVRNGLPLLDFERSAPPGKALRFGYLGVFSERKGFKGLFEILDELSRMTDLPWEAVLAGSTQESDGERLVDEIKKRFSNKPWWSRVQWCGWTKDPGRFLASIDLLICPSSEFDPFPTVLLEAGRAGIPVVGARVGGVPEIVESGMTGWLFEPQQWGDAALQLKALLQSPGLAMQAGTRAKKRVEQHFAIGRMVSDYLRVYTGLAAL